jgi:putative membrane protein
VQAGRGGGEGVRIRDHLANTRTLLAWLRLAMALMGLGFAADKLELIVGSRRTALGIGAAAAGLIVAVLGGAGYQRRRLAIDRPELRVRYRFDVVMAAAAAAGGLLVLWLLVAR